MWLCCACSKPRYCRHLHLCGSAVHAVGAVGITVSVLCWLFVQEQEAYSCAVLAAGTGDMRLSCVGNTWFCCAYSKCRYHVALLCLQLVWRHVTAMLAVVTGDTNALLCL